MLFRSDRVDDERRRGVDRGPLHGVLIGVKDIVDVAGYPTRCGSPLYPDRAVEHDAEVVTHLRRAGAVIAGKTATHELACGVVTAPTANPWNTQRVPGGSSGGSGSAVGAGLVPIGLGSGACGVIAARDALGLKTRIVGVVSANANAYELSWNADKVIDKPGRTVAEGLEIASPHPEAFKWLKRGLERIEIGRAHV